MGGVEGCSEGALGTGSGAGLVSCLGADAPLWSASGALGEAAFVDAAPLGDFGFVVVPAAGIIGFGFAKPFAPDGAALPGLLVAAAAGPGLAAVPPAGG